MDFNSPFAAIAKLSRQVRCLMDNIVLASNSVGGMSAFVADGNVSTFDINHNLGAIPSYFTLTTTEPITNNHLNRTITFPDVNTMRITFAFPPSPGENANYVWIVYK